MSGFSENPVEQGMQGVCECVFLPIGGVNVMRLPVQSPGVVSQRQTPGSFCAVFGQFVGTFISRAFHQEGRIVLY